MAVIGVFDSGRGGRSVANAITKAMPEHRVVFKNDTKNVPYGTKDSDTLYSLVLPILKSMVDKGCDVLVIACNTVTTTLIAKLRREFDIPLIGMEPMVKPAAELTKSKKIAICATPTTLASTRYKELKQKYAKSVTVIEPDCSDWSYMIESRQVDQSKIKSITRDVCDKGADIIVLGCTHYHWIENIIKTYAAGQAIVLQPEEPVITQLKKILSSSRQVRRA